MYFWQGGEFSCLRDYRWSTKIKRQDNGKIEHLQTVFGRPSHCYKATECNGEKQTVKSTPCFVSPRCAVAEAERDAECRDAGIVYSADIGLTSHNKRTAQQIAATS